MRPILLDTCALLWMTQEGQLHFEAEEALRENEAAGHPTLVSPMFDAIAC